jgi:hypothetical protein
VVSFVGLIEQIAFFSYRLSSHALLNWADDPALLAIVFC